MVQLISSIVKDLDNQDIPHINQQCRRTSPRQEHNYCAADKAKAIAPAAKVKILLELTSWHLARNLSAHSLHTESSSRMPAAPTAVCQSVLGVVCGAEARFPRKVGGSARPLVRSWPSACALVSSSRHEEASHHSRAQVIRYNGRRPAEATRVRARVLDTSNLARGLQATHFSWTRGAVIRPWLCVSTSS